VEFCTTVLLTGFEPFGTSKINPSWQAASMVAERRGDVVAVDLPYEFDWTIPALRAAIEEHRPEVVVRAAGVPSSASCTAGTAGCNHAFHGLIHLPATDFPGLRGGFVHVPFAPGQAADARPSLPIEQSATALSRYPKRASHTGLRQAMIWRARVEDLGAELSSRLARRRRVLRAHRVQCGRSARSHRDHVQMPD
jgi:pyroglutamyl-peptidase